MLRKILVLMTDPNKILYDFKTGQKFTGDKPIETEENRFVANKIHEGALRRYTLPIEEESGEEPLENPPELQLEAMTVEQLKGLAKEKSIDGYNKMKKEELVTVLKVLGEVGPDGNNSDGGENQGESADPNH